MSFYNETGILGQLIYSATVNITGDLFLTLLCMVIIVVAFLAAFRIPLEISAVFILPLLLVLMAYSGQFVAVGGVLLVYLAVIIGKNFIL